MATSILRKKAQAEKLAFLTIITEKGVGCSSKATTIKLGDRQEDGAEDVFPTCYVEEDPFMEDLSTTQEPRAMEATHRDESGPNFALADDIPSCIVTRADVNADNNRLVRKVEVDGAEMMELDVGIGVTVELRDISLNDVGDGLHGSLLCAEHLALVFEL
jgi:hypothetical protein